MNASAKAKLSDSTFVAFDVETTGLDARTDKVVEFGAVRFDRNGRLEEYAQLVNPGCPIPPAALSVHGITDEEVAGSPAVREVLPEMVEFLGESVLLAHNAPFDIGFFDAAFADAGIAPPANPILCTVELARAAFPRLRDHKLTTLVRELHIPEGEHHRALADAIYGSEVFKRCVDRFDESWALSLDDLLKRHGPPFVFGVTPSRALEAVEAAIFNNERLRIEYRDARGKITVRDISPVEIPGRGRQTKVIAFCHLRGEQRTFRIDCIKKIL